MIESFAQSVLGGVGLAHIVVGSSIFGPVRRLVLDRAQGSRAFKFLSEGMMCYQCCGFWTGLVAGAALGFPASVGEAVGLVLVVGPASSVLSDLTYRLKQKLCSDCG